MTYGLPPGQRKARVKILTETVFEGGTTSDFCRKTGLSHTAASNWLRANEPELRAKLQANRRHGPIKRPKLARGLISM